VTDTPGPDDGPDEESDRPGTMVESETVDDSVEYLHDAEPTDDLGTPGRPLNQRSPFMWGFLGGAGALLALWLGLLVLRIGGVLVLVVVALFLAVGLNPLVEFLMRRGLKRPWAVLVVITGVLLVFAGFLFTIVPVVTEQVTTLSDNLPHLFDQLQRNATIRRFDDKYDVSGKVTDYIQNGGVAEKAFGGALGVALLDVIPMIGATIGAFIVCAIAFATDVTTGVICVIFYIAYQQLENYLIYPRVMSHTVSVPGAVTVIAALIGASLLGVIGALLAIPTAASVLMLVREVWLPRQETR
jgi:predicted PurR-regulated permease PerM